MKWAHKAADKGNAHAMDFMGWMFFRGKGVKRNPQIHPSYFDAASTKTASASWNLGLCYFGAQNVDSDIPKALESWKNLTAKGCEFTATNATILYLSADGIAPDTAEAWQLAKRTAELNDTKSLVLLREIEFQAGKLFLRSDSNLYCIGSK